jgi:hypothetical protein
VLICFCHSWFGCNHMSDSRYAATLRQAQGERSKNLENHVE